jgi:hypothetical protein
MKTTKIVKTLNKVKGLNPIVIEMNKLMYKHKKLFNEVDVYELMDDLQHELLYLLTTCVKYKTGKIPLRNNIAITDLVDNPNAYSTYGYKYIKQTNWNTSDSSDNYYISKTPGLKAYNSRNNNDFDLLAQRYVMIDGDLYGNDDIDFGRTLHINHLRILAQQKRTKVIAVRVEQFIKWLETLTLFKHDLYKFGGNEGYDYSWQHISEGKQFTCYNIFALINKEIGAEISQKTLPKIKQRLIELEQEKVIAITQGKEYLKQLKTINLAARTLAEIKGQ